MEWNAPGYTEIKELGVGGSGRVVLAVHDETGVKVAIKYLSEKLRRDPVSLARFQSEARLLTTLRDSHIATMWEYIQDRYGAAIVMELVNGVSLRALLRENGTTGPEAALVVLKGSLLGLARAHGLGLVHRDYKPENVIVRDDGASKLVDFGIAVREGTASHPEGTPPYMAPELWGGLPASPATDVYAATAVFFECLTGHRPYRSTEPSVLGYQHMHAPVPVHDAPEPMRELIARGMSKDPATRPASAAAFVEELEETARRAYGDDWEERGRRRLAGLVVLLALLLPVPQPAPAQVTTSLARTVFRSGLRTARHNAVRLAMGTGLAAVAAITVVLVLASRQSTTPIDVAAAQPPASGAPTSLAPAELGSPSETPEAPETPVTLSVTPVDEPAVASVPPGGSDPDVGDGGGASAPPETKAAAVTTPTRHTPTPLVKITPKTTPKATPKFTPKATPKFTPKVTPKATPKFTPKTPKTPKITPSVVITPTPPTPTPTPTPPVVTSVSGLNVGGIAVDDATAGAAMFLRTTGTGPVTVTASWSVAGQTVRTQRLPLDGSRFYNRPLRYAMAERPCGKSVSLTVATVPAAPGGPRTVTTSVPPCPTEVTGLRVALNVAAAPGRTATARVRVTTSGTDAVPVEARFTQNRETLTTRTATLSGRKSYSRTFSYSFRTRPCGSTLSVTVRAGDRTATATARVTCPPHVLKVTLDRAALVRATASAYVSVTTANVQPVRLSVSFYLGGRLVNSQTFPLSDDTSYTRSVRHSFGKVPCGTSWSVVATTRPRPDSGAARAGGTTPACAEDPKPDDQTDEPDDHESAPPKTDDQPETDRPQTDDPESEQPDSGSID